MIALAIPEPIQIVAGLLLVAAAFLIIAKYA